MRGYRAAGGASIDEQIDIIGSAPPTLTVGDDPRRAVYEIAADLVADHAVADAPQVRRAGGRAAPVDAGPVYRHAADGRLAIPTGRAFVRFREGEPAERHRDELARAGFELEDAPRYAPSAAWVRARSGRIADTLSGLGALSALEGVEHVEPQMLSERSHR